MTEPLHDSALHAFASDNYAGIHPEVLDAIAGANGGHQVSYGDDVYSARLEEVARARFGDEAHAFPVFNGTGANVIALQACLPRWGAVICAATGHIAVDEAGAPERVGGLKLLPVQGPDGKLTPELIDREAWGWGDVHRAQPLAVSLSQSTELGTVYSPDEIRAIADHAHARGMLVHLDGARLPNAAASLGLALRETTRDCGVDLISLGGTKNGLLGAEAVIVFDERLADAVRYLRKIDLQLASKARFLSAQLVALYEGDLWWRSASQANAMGRLLRTTLEQGIAEGRMPGLAFTQPTQANAVFATLPAAAAERLRRRARFYDWHAARHEVRWMCSWDTQEHHVLAFAEAVADELGAEATITGEPAAEEPAATGTAARR